ncbi:hypothetical protein BBD42_03235 [Paenibacillus sp. BIHB 4019]|uniref:Butirosin biosynthesis protein H N-terminal domain-containing protein n=1 Tax=Paenibacillus sp. BIHB 4019 TaxID=1870819 RepID=A0A1B2DCY9_9BACL|nr:hypothetical protein [Paenibacillus sp. BIHB 4019]ANY65581.1 hypothetical protein BBD42_03235 [Paenibacillus sp. BIHB 4019]
MKIHLPLADSPIYGYLHHAYLFGIIGHSESFQPWMHSYYTQLFCAKDFVELACPVNFYQLDNCPLRETQAISRSLVNSLTDIHRFIQTSLEQGYHVLSFINEYYMPYSDFFGVRNFTHDLLISGYDSEQQSYLVTNFVDGKYQTFSVSYDDYENAFNNAAFFDEYGNYEEYKTRICLYRATDHKYVFTADSVLYFLKDYLSATNRLKTLFANESNLAFGMDVYQYIAEEQVKVTDGTRAPDGRPLHILWEHKKCMRAKIEFMLAQGYIKDETLLSGYEPIERDVNLQRVALMKYRQTNNNDILHSINSNLNRIKDREREVLNRLHDEMLACKSYFPTTDWVRV